MNSHKDSLGTRHESVTRTAWGTRTCNQSQGTDWGPDMNSVQGQPGTDMNQSQRDSLGTGPNQHRVRLGTDMISPMTSLGTRHESDTRTAWGRQNQSQGQPGDRNESAKGRLGTDIISTGTGLGTDIE